MILRWTFEVELAGEEAFVYEREQGKPGTTRWGPMPRDMAGPFVDERREFLSEVYRKLIEQRSYWLPRPGDRAAL